MTVLGWKRWPSSSGEITALGWSSDIPFLFLGCKNGKLVVYQLPDPSSQKPYMIACLAVRPFSPVIAIHASPLQPHLMLILYQDSTLVLWHLLEAKVHLKFSNPNWAELIPSYTMIIHATSATWSPDGSHIMVMYDHGWLSLWNSECVDPVATLKVTHHETCPTPQTEVCWMLNNFDSVDTTSLYLSIISTSSPEKNRVLLISMPKSPKKYAQLSKASQSNSLNIFSFEFPSYQGNLRCSLMVYESSSLSTPSPLYLLLISTHNHIVAHDLQNSKFPRVQLPAHLDMSNEMGTILECKTFELSKEEFETLWSLYQQLKPTKTLFNRPESMPSWPCTLVLLVFSLGTAMLLISPVTGEQYPLPNLRLYFEPIKEIVVGHLPESLQTQPSLMSHWYLQFQFTSVQFDVHHHFFVLIAKNGTLVRVQAKNFLIKEAQHEKYHWKSLENEDSWDLWTPLTYAVDHEAMFESFLYVPISVFFNVPCCASLFRSTLAILDFDAWHFFDFRNGRYKIIQPGDKASFIKHVDQDNFIVSTLEKVYLWNQTTASLNLLNIKLPILQCQVHLNHALFLTSKELLSYKEEKRISKFKAKNLLGFSVTHELVLTWSANKVFLLRFPSLSELHSVSWKISPPCSLAMVGSFFIKCQIGSIHVDSYLYRQRPTVNSVSPPNPMTSRTSTSITNTMNLTLFPKPTSLSPLVPEIEKVFRGHELQDKLAERGERLEHLAMKFSELNTASSNFASMAKKLNEKSKKESKWKFF
ncbi:hypothetical protein HMI56_001877 [Coelomomyces lativittatus]|nr:hypothetical protein HMI56_001877 [Coelomomyces lativittatus]